MSTTDDFYEHQKDKSRVKTLIVTDFLKAYFPIINRSVGKDKKEIIYIDLFCGPGKFENEQPSTPLALLDLLNKNKNDDIMNKLRIVLNDEKSDYIEKLREIVDNHEILSRLKYKPEISNKCASEVDIKVHTIKDCPIFSFIDPWGYKDVSVSQTWELVKNIGSDCVLFFNSNRFIMDIPKETQTCHFKDIFGEQLTEVEKIVNDPIMRQKQKTQKIVELFSRNLCDEMSKSKYKGYKLYLLPFSFEADDKNKISHHILFITKNHKAIIEMKKVMLRHSNANDTTLSFDSKDQFQISFLNRKDLIEDEIIGLIQNCINMDCEFVRNTWNIDKLLEALDSCNMNNYFQVTPYSRDEVKIVIEILDNKGFIKITIPPGKKTKKRVTFDRDFKIKKELLV